MSGLKKLRLVAAFIVLAWLLVFVASPVYAVTWGSYNDAEHNNPDETFASPEFTVYMYGTAFTATHPYKVSYYEADINGGDTADLVSTDLVWSDSSGNLESSYYFPTDPTVDPGLWHAVVYDWDDTPANPYDSGDVNILADDDFTVQGSAIPEFPTVMAMVVAIGLSFGIYYRMRKGYHKQAVTARQ